MARVAVAAGSRIAADAGTAAAANGGNAVDAAIAASLVSMTTDPGIIALGAGSYIAIQPPKEPAVVVDAYAEMPGRSASADRFGRGADTIHLEYGGGTTTLVGHGSVATPGSIAGFGLAAERYGVIGWEALFEPAIYWAEQGFPLSGGAAEYLTYTHELIFGRHPETRAALHHDDGSPLRAGEVVQLPGLAPSLDRIARDGAACFYTGELGVALADEITAHGGLLGRDDLAAYRPVERRALTAVHADWELSTNPGPAIGGAAVAAFLELTAGVDGWDADNVARMVGALDAVLTHRAEHVDGAADPGPAVERLIELARGGDPSRLLSSPSTIHVSAVDEHGLACSISTSSGYGSGVVIPGTGIWLNNSLGEVDLLRSAIHVQRPGTRLPSNMAPSIARHADGTVIALGSPGASRITSAVGQVLLNHLRIGMPLAEAIEHPRFHVETFGGRHTIAIEPGVDLDRVAGMTPRRFDGPSMYFGGTQAAVFDPVAGLSAHADPRRMGGVAIGG